TAIVHGADQAEKMQKGAEALFAGRLDELDSELIQQVFAEGPTAEIDSKSLKDGISIIDLAADTGLVPSKGEARRKLKAGAIYINDKRVEGDQTATEADVLPSGVIILRMGKKKYLVVKLKN
ncbi:tyrosine--tRNA ligase, partial [bacterium]|nr:tyrosine--tRNA ligase [bacterium]